MASTLAEVVPLALGVALSPLAVLALLLMLLSDHELANARAFLAGWVVTLAALVTAAMFANVSLHTSHPPPAVTIAEVVTGAVLVSVAAGATRSRRRRGPDLRTSRWLASLDQISLVRAFGLAVALVLLNVKDAALTIAAGSAISGASLPASQAALALTAFTATAALTIAVPFAVAVFAGANAQPTLRRWHRLLERDGNTLVAIVLCAGGLLLMISGLRAM